MNDLGDKITKAQELRAKRRKRLERKQNDEDAIREDIHEVNRDLDKLRERRENNREDGDDDKADRWADEIEDLEDVKDDLLEDLDAKKERTKESEKLLRDAQQRVRGLRKKREAREKSRKGNGDLTPHFSVAEFNCRDGTPVPQAAIPALRLWCQNVGEPLRARYGKPVRVNSGYRTRSYNLRIGGASMSVHIYDEHPGAVAVDHYVEGVSPAEVANFEDGLAEVSGLGRYHSFTHSDNRHRIGWAQSEWFGP